MTTPAESAHSSVSSPAISVVVPAYNAADTLEETLEAITSQTYRDWECIVVDDGSTDDSRAIADSFASRDGRFIVISQENRGSAGAYNTGVKAASNEWVCICSADDILLADHLGAIASAIRENPAIDVFSTNGYFWMEDGTRKVLYSGARAKTAHGWPLARVIAVCFFSVGATYRKRWFDVVGGYREDVFGEDWDFWLRIMVRGARHLYLPQRSALHRVSDSQKSADLARAYRSDIRILTDLCEAHELTDSDLGAVRESIARREHLIGEVEKAQSAGRSTTTSPGKLLIRRILDATLGFERTEEMLGRRSKR